MTDEAKAFLIREIDKTEQGLFHLKRALACLDDRLAMPVQPKPEAYIVWDNPSKQHFGSTTVGLIGYAFDTMDHAESWRDSYRPNVPPVMPLFP